MNEKLELTTSIARADSLKRMQRMPGWKIIEDFLAKADYEYNKQLKNDTNDDMADVKACRKIIGFIGDFRGLLRITELSADEDQRELDLLKKGDNIQDDKRQHPQNRSTER